MSKTNTGLVKYAKKQLGKPYWYGCFGQTSTKALYKSKKAQYPDQYAWACPDNQLGKRVHDCVGLIKGYLWSDTADSAPVYNSRQDVSANGMLSVCTKKGRIDSMPDLPGVLVFKNGHVGVYIGNGKVVEAMGHKYGVVETALSARPWTHWGCCPWIEYKDTAKKHKKYFTPDATVKRDCSVFADNNLTAVTGRLYKGESVKVRFAGKVLAIVQYNTNDGYKVGLVKLGNLKMNGKVRPA